MMRLIENSRRKRTSDNGVGARRNVVVTNGVASGIQVPKELHSKPNLKYHHQRKHPNGSVSGSYAQMDASGQLKVTHYVNDDKGFR